jgi:hypothetical protein
MVALDVRGALDVRIERVWKFIIKYMVEFFSSLVEQLQLYPMLQARFSN